MEFKQINRWNLILGQPESGQRECAGLSELLDFVYASDSEDRGDRLSGGRQASRLTVPDFVASAKNLLPDKGFGSIVKHAVKKYKLNFLLAEDEVLERVKPDADILKAVLSFKSALKPERLDKVRVLVKKIADELTEKLITEVAPALFGARRSFLRGYSRRLKNLDIKATVRRNLKTYNPAEKRLLPEKLIFRADARKRLSKRLILLIDESGSMIDSVINTAVLAGILSKVGFLDVRVAAFDTSVIDLSDMCGDVASLMLSVQLGGGTDIDKALRYAIGLTEEPKKTVVVLISDLCDGFGYTKMYRSAAAVTASGAKLFCLTALDYGKGAAYDEAAAKKMAALGARVGALSPKELCEWIVREVN